MKIMLLNNEQIHFVGKSKTLEWLRLGLSDSYKVEVRYLGEKNIEHVEQYVKIERTITLSCEKHMSEERKDLKSILSTITKG